MPPGTAGSPTVRRRRAKRVRHRAPARAPAGPRVRRARTWARTTPLSCEDTPFEISVTGQAPPCETTFANLRFLCVQFVGGGGRELTARLAMGCGDVVGCEPEPNSEFSIEVGGLDFRDVLLLDNDATECGLLVLHGTPQQDDSCTWDLLAAWSSGPGNAGLRLALGNGPPDERPALTRPDGTAIGLRTEPHGPTTCGFDAGCDGAGWKRLLVGIDADPALPDGVPVPARFPAAAQGPDPVAYSLFNWGLQLDLSCAPRGRWAVLPQSQASIFEE